MLDSINIKNFKSIGEKGLVLNNLNRINYLVGANGSGKSAILEFLYIYVNEQKSKFLMFPNSEIYLQNPPESLKLLCHNNNILKQEFQVKKILPNSNHEIVDYVNTYNQSDLNQNIIPYSLIDIMTISYKNSKGKLYNSSTNVFSETRDDVINVLKILGIELYDDINHFNADSDLGETVRSFKLKNKNNQKLYNINFLAGGYIYIIKLSFILSAFCEQLQNSNSVICIEEPEAQLHPKFQKLLPQIFQYFSDIYNKDSEKIKFIISTHSPFLISKSASYADSQKVYLIDNGFCTNPDGAKGGGAKKLAMEMLGAGLDDILPEKIVLCESEGRGVSLDKPNYQKDAIIYQYLYGNEENAGFYSTGSNQNVYENSKYIRDLIDLIINGHSPNVSAKIIGFIDHDYKVNKNNNKYPLRNTGSFNNIESFLYHDSVIIELDSTLPKFSDDGIDRHAESWFTQNQEALSVICKESVDWSENKRSFWQSEFEKKVLAPIILKMKDDKTSIYWEMHRNIFGTSS